MLNKDSKLSAEGQNRVAICYGLLINGSFGIPSHHIHAFGNFREFVRVLKFYYQVDKLEDIGKMFEEEGELFLTDQVIAFITSHKKLPIKVTNREWKSEPYPKDLEVSNYYTSYGKI